ncbi:MAG: hypothetical protein JXR97_09070 [Planctomycetes bacterium]|nr:hypothetical protein [Planctomycetota bacterium]
MLILMNIIIAVTETGGGGFDLKTLILLGIIVALSVLSPILVRKRKQVDAPRLDDIRKMESDIRTVRSAADQALVDLLETSREISAQIDTKIRVLNKLVKDADDRCRKLETMIRISEGELSVSELDKATENEAEKNIPEREAAESGSGDCSSIAEPAKTRSGRWVSKIHARIEALGEEGKTPAEIARITNLSLQEVNLVLHMLNKS